MARRSIRGEWDAYRASLPPQPAAERVMLRRTYYAGALAALALFLDCGELPEDEGLRLLELVKAEIREFCARGGVEVL